MTSFEKIVRPFQDNSEGFSINRLELRYPPEGSVVDSVLIEFGKGGDDKYLPWAPSGFNGGVVKEGEDPEDPEPETEIPPQEVQEVTRTVEVVRVENPQDPEQFVDVERIREINLFDKKNKQDIKWSLNA